MLTLDQTIALGTVESQPAEVVLSRKFWKDHQHPLRPVYKLSIFQLHASHMTWTMAFLQIKWLGWLPEYYPNPGGLSIQKMLYSG